jgi:hypothetical protein
MSVDWMRSEDLVDMGVDEVVLRSETSVAKYDGRLE